jgi:predicted metalloprotease with PDZ domain
MPLLIVVIAVTAAGMVATSLLIPPRRHAAHLPGMTTADGDEGQGVLVTSVKSGSAADRAGIRVGDTILALDGQRITSHAAALKHDLRPMIDMQVAHNHAIRHVTLKQGDGED